MCVHLFYVWMSPLFYCCCFVSWEDCLSLFPSIFLSILLNYDGRYFRLGIRFGFVVDPKSSETGGMNRGSRLNFGCT